MVVITTWILYLFFSSMDQQPSPPSDRTDHEGGVNSDAILAIINAEFPAANSGANSGVIQNAGATVSDETNSFVSPFVQSSVLGAPAAGHAVATQARETLTPIGSISGGAAISTFGFSNLFNGNATLPVPLFSTPSANAGAGPAQTSAMSAATLHGVSPPTSQPIVPAQQLPSGGSTSLSPVNFATISAEQLVHRLRQKIQALDVEAWKVLEFDGPTILELSSPALLPGQLTEYFGYNGLLRDRVANAIKLLIINDESVVIDIRKFWGFVPAGVLPAVTPTLGSSANQPVLVSSATPPPSENYIQISSGSQHTPSARGGGDLDPPPYTPLAPNQLFNQSAIGAPAKADNQSFSFLSEFSSTQNYSLDHSVIPSTPAALTTPATGNIASAAGAAIATGTMGQQINITLHQPTLQKYNWMILENLDTRATFYQWLKKNRREKIIADAANQRPLTSLVSDTVRQDVMRIYNTERDAFDSKTPIYTYAYVTDEVLLKILFYRFGPLNAREAVLRLKEQKFLFDDSTTLQDRFGPKLRRHTTEFRQSLLDMKYTAKHWPESNNMLTHPVIVDAFLATFEKEDDIFGPDGRTKVPKCASMQIIRDMIRDNKQLKLDPLIDLITKRFEDVDAAVRSNSLIKHNVQPWKTQGKFNARKRKYEQVSSAEYADTQPQTKKQAQDSSNGNPRCANCGSKGHICGERTCYFWGHPKAKGKDGKWADGTPSLRLEDDEMKEWRGTRQEVFYSYPENSHKNNKTAQGGKQNKAKPFKGVAKK